MRFSFPGVIVLGSNRVRMPGLCHSKAEIDRLRDADFADAAGSVELIAVAGAEIAVEVACLIARSDATQMDADAA